MKNYLSPTWKTPGICISLTILIMLSSCVNLKKVELIQQKTITDYSEEIFNAERDAYKINNGDHLYIKVFSSDSRTSKFFQTDFPEIMTSSYVYLNSYKVDEEGYVKYSYIDRIKVKGKTLEEAQITIKKAIEEYFKDVNVYVKLVNFSISIIGEVENPGNYTVDRDQITILQALSMAGGVTPWAKADQVTLVRKSPNGSLVKYIDITDNALLTSEYLFLMPDDVIYITPRGTKQFLWEKFPYGILLGVISIGFSLYAIFD